MIRRRLFVLGAGVYQVPLICRAQEMGLETIVASIPGSYPGIPLADRFLPIDTTDVDGIVRAAEELEVGGIVTTGTDVCVPAIGAVVDRLGLPGTGYEVALRSMDKVRMKQAFAHAGVPTAPFEVVTTFAEAQEVAKRIGYPLMVKAIDSSGGRGITKVGEAKRLEAAWQRARDVTRSPQVILEHWLDGVEFGAQAFVHGDRVVAVFPHNDTVTPPPYSTPIGHSMPSDLSPEAERRTAEAIQQAVAVLGITDVVSNVDLMLVDGEPMLIEIGARMGATCLPEIVATYAGFDIYEHVIHLALGELCPLSTCQRQPNAALLLRSPANGIVTRLEVPEEVRAHPGLVRLQLDVRRGDPVKEFVVGPDRIGDLVVTGDTSKEAERLVEELAERIIIEVGPET